MKIVKKIVIWFFLIVPLVITSGIAIAYFFEKDVNAFFVKQIDKHLETKIDVKKIHFSILKKFPNASVEFSDVVAFSAKDLQKKDFKIKNTDTLFTAEKLFFEFNIIDILNKKYKIHKINIRNGELYIAVDKKGNDNYHFFNSNKIGGESFNINLKEISLSNVRVIYHNLLKQTQLQVYSKNLSLRGNFSAENYLMSTKGDLKFEKIIFGNVNYVKTNDVSLSLGVEVENNNFKILKGQLSISDLIFAISGEINIGEKTYPNIIIKGKKIRIESLLSILPKGLDFLKKDYSGTGDVFFTTKINGQISKFQSPHIETNFSVKDATIINKKSKIKITGFFAKGFFSTGKQNKPKSSYLNVSEFRAALNESNFNGSVSFKNFNLPDLHVKINADCNLSEMQKFLKIKNIQHISGNLKTTIDFFDKIKNFNNYSFNSFKNSLTGGSVYLKNVNFQLTRSNYNFLNISGKANFNGNDVDVKKMTFQTCGNKFKFSGKINNLFSYLFEEKHTLFINGSVYSPNIIVDSFLFVNTNSEQKKMNFSRKINFKLNLKAGNFSWDKFCAKNVTGFLNYSNKSMSFRSLLFDSMQGKVSADGVFSQNRNGNFALTSIADLIDIDISKLFLNFDNFGQEFISYNNLKGLCVANVNLFSEWKNNFDFIPSTFYVTSSLTINNGELIDFDPAEKLSSFAKIEELKHIKFSSLTNDIIIKNEKVIIPEMKVNSSAFNLSFSGTQSFKGNISYKAKLLLSELLAKKAGISKKENNEFGVIEDDGLGKTSLYFKIFGTTDDYQIKYDTKRVEKQMKNRFKQEKKVFKTILNEEFGLFKKDSSIMMDKINKKNKKSPVQPFIIEWNEDDTIN
ncbi:MAG: hypothetical protein IMY72_08010 [Bacteroidetes bacterium]|nr:hypothetical protein [Bacteroidota bacterium]